jgi:hypothetical protein
MVAIATVNTSVRRVRGCQKIQSICNGNAKPSAMQGFDRAREKLLPQEQWTAMKRTMGSNEKTIRRTMETARGSGRMLTSDCETARQAVAVEKQNAPEVVRLRARECHSALNAMRRSRRECKRD